VTTYEEIVGESRDIIQQYKKPLTLRQLYYRLVAKMLIQNNLNMYKRLSSWMVKARVNGDINHRKIVDRVRYIDGEYQYYESPDAFKKYWTDRFLNGWRQYTRSIWEGQQYYVEVWIEKDALFDGVSEVADEHRCITAVARGYSSFSFVRDALDRWQDPLDLGREIRVIYLTDFDPAGEDMVRDLKSRISRYSSLDGDEIVQKVALTLDQVELYNLPTAPMKTRQNQKRLTVFADSRAAAFAKKYGNAVVELDALEPPTLQDIVRTSIRQYIDTDRWNSTVETSQHEQQVVMEWLAKLSTRVTVE
jgi:hypothetical protein